MKSPRPLLVLLAAALATGIGFEILVTSPRRAELQALALRRDTAERARTEAERRRSDLARDLALAEQQLGRLPPIRLPAADTASADAALVAAWQARVAQLRALVAAHPDHTVPELQLLDDSDWLRVAQSAAFATEADRRRTLALLRTAAKNRFATLLVGAVGRFRAAYGDRRPDSALELAPYLSPPAAPAMLARYAVADSDSRSSRGGWVVREAAAVDADYDSRHRVGSDGSHGSGSGLLTWIDDLPARLERARRAYLAAHATAPPVGLSAVLPFLDPPLAPELAAKILATERTGPR